MYNSIWERFRTAKLHWQLSAARYDESPVVVAHSNSLLVHADCADKFPGYLKVVTVRDHNDTRRYNANGFMCLCNIPDEELPTIYNAFDEPEVEKEEEEDHLR